MATEKYMIVQTREVIVGNPHLIRPVFIIKQTGFVTIEEAIKELNDLLNKHLYAVIPYYYE